MKKLFKIFLISVFVLSLVPQHMFAAPVLQTACEQDVTVQADDWLSKLAEKFYGDVLAFPAIVEATNAAGGDYATISNPDVIEPGWKLCIPSGADAQALLGSESGAAMASGVEVPGEPSEISSVAWGNFNANYLANVLNELADENGWLQDYGMTDQEVTIMDQELVFPALLGGSLHMALQDTDAVAGAQLAGADLIYIANYRDKEPWILTVREGVDITNPAGVTCSGGGAGGRNEFNAKEMVKRLGGDPEQMEWIPIGGGSDSRVQAFVEGQIDCVQHFDRHRALVAEANGVTIYDELENVPQDGFVVTREFAQENPRFVINYLKALIKARRVLNDLGNKDQIIEIMRNRGYEIPQEFVDQYERQMNIINDSENFDIAAMETLIADSVRTGSLEESIDWRQFVDMSYLEQAYRELGMEDEIQSYE